MAAKAEEVSPDCADHAARLLRQLGAESLRRLTQKGLEVQLTPEDVIAEHGAEPKVWRPNGVKLTISR